MNRRTLIASLLLSLAAAICGCQKPMHFPASSMTSAADQAGATGAYDTNGDGMADYFTFADAAGRIVRIGYDTDGQAGPDEIVNLDELEYAGRRHVAIILDGFGYDVVKGYYDSGGLRLLHPPSRVIAPYPTLTDLAIEDILNYIPCRGFEAKYFDRERNKIVGGSWAYMMGRNEPYNRLLDYRANLLWDAIGYLFPWKIFGKEVNDLARLTDRQDRRDVLAYMVSSAGMGTIDGAEGQLRALKLVDRLVQQLVWSSRGLTQVTLLADHGHSYTPSTQIPLDGYLKDKGWRLVNSLKGPKDVAYIRFGLETYASFACRRPAELAADLATCHGVTVVSYVEGESVVVLSGDGGRATINKQGDRYSYKPTAGDPLKLTEALASVAADADGYRPDLAIFDATAQAEYPDPLDRLWRAHFSLAENAPDVIISLADEYYSGAATFGGAVKIASTHGGLNRANSTTFIMSTAGTLPPVMRSRDIPSSVTKLLGAPWPGRRP